MASSKPQCLLARIFKHNYFPASNVLSAPVGPSSSFIWRSIMATRYLIQAGSRWQVRNGLSISILHDCWIARSLLFRVIAALHSLNPEATMDVLLTGDGTWNKDLINVVFVPDDAEAILHTSIGGEVDTLRWHYEKYGCFTVRSAFRLAYREARHESSAHDETSSARLVNWSFIWSACVPPKVRLFAWIVCRNGYQR
ncbi:UNVERIFIED_CONTAM: hypothetical protein Slati_2091500 [Sesamum latifolium]|uniref:Reverse transcriptase zinc-binding domain-containing protein n=1 Tax=Sesamum latifolium TaxID=2727402 RepID=A0AAW2WQK7_9LAMI